MNHKQRGIAVIFNHEYFDYYTRQTRRTGTHVDLERLLKTLKKLDFDVRDFTDLRTEQITKQLKKSEWKNDLKKFNL